MTNALLGMLTVLVTTNFVGVTFTPIPCPHPGCTEGHHSFTATERYMIIRDTWAEVVEAPWKQLPKQNYRIYSDTNDWGNLSHPIAHPSIYHMHTQPGWPVRPGTRWPLDMPPLPPWETYERARAPRRSSTTNLPGDSSITNSGALQMVKNEGPHFVIRADNGPSGYGVYNADGTIIRKDQTEAFKAFLKTNLQGILYFAVRDAKPPTDFNKLIYSASGIYPAIVRSTNWAKFDTNAYGSHYNVTTNFPGYNLVIERRATDRSSGDRAYPGNAVERHFNPVTPYWPGPAHTNPPTIHAWGTQYHPTATNEVHFRSGSGLVFKDHKPITNALPKRSRSVPVTTEMDNSRRFKP